MVYSRWEVYDYTGGRRPDKQEILNQVTDYIRKYGKDFLDVIPILKPDLEKDLSKLKIETLCYILEAFIDLESLAD